MKAEAAECVRTAVVLGPRQQRAGGARPARLPRARGLPLGRGRRGDGAACARRVRAVPADARARDRRRSRTRCWSTTRSSSSRSSRHYALHVATAASAAAAPRRARARRAAAHRLPVGRLPPARHQPADGADARVPRPQRVRGDAALGRPGRRQRRCASACAPPASTSRSCTARASTQMAARDPRARHRHPGRPQGRDLRHRCCRCWRSGRRRCRSTWLGFPGHHRRAATSTT